MNEKNTMVRPCKCRQIHGIPGAMAFKPAGKPVRQLKQVELGPDEFEAIRLADMEDVPGGGREKIGISRATRADRGGQDRKIATALVGPGAIIQLDGTEPLPRMSAGNAAAVSPRRKTGPNLNAQLPSSSIISTGGNPERRIRMMAGPGAAEGGCGAAETGINRSCKFMDTATGRSF